MGIQTHLTTRGGLTLASLLSSLILVAGAHNHRAAVAAELQYPLGIVASENGTIYLADRNLPGVWKVEQGKLSLYFEGSKKFRTPLNAVRCLAIDQKGRLLAGDSSTRDLYRFDESHKPLPLTDGHIGIPMGIAVGQDGQILVADLELHRIWRIPPDGGKPEEMAEVPAPRAVFFDTKQRLWVVSHGPNQLVRLSPEAKPETVVSGRPFRFPSAVVVASDETAYVCDTYGPTIWRIPPGKSPEKWVSGKPLVSPVALALSGDHVLVVDPRAKAVFEIGKDGKATRLELTIK